MATGFNFRSTLVYVTDAAHEAGAIPETYPVTRNGSTFGWTNASGVGGRNRNATNDPRLAGNCQVVNTSQRTWQLDLPAAGTYTVHIALGDQSSAQAYEYLQIKDGASVLLTIDDSDGTASNNYDDASGANNTYAAWIASNGGAGGGVSASLTFTGTLMTVLVGRNVGGTSGSSALAHISVVAAGGGSGSTISATLSDTSTFTDALTRDGVFDRTLTDSLSFSDVLAIDRWLTRELGDSATPSDALSCDVVLDRILSDVFGFSDALVVLQPEVVAAVSHAIHRSHLARRLRHHRCWKH